MIELTPSKVRTFLSCPKQYQLVNLQRRGSRETSPALSFGISMHGALEELHNQSKTKNNSLDLKEVLRRRWTTDGYADNHESEAYFNIALEALHKYLDSTEHSRTQILGTEIFLSRVVRLDGSRVRFGCKVDRLELHHDGVLEVLDYKTNASGKVPTEESLATDLPTFVYYLLARISYPQHEQVVVSQLNVRTMSKVQVNYDDNMLTTNKQALIELVHEIESNSFKPRPNGACAWCPVRDYCPLFGSEANLDELF